MLKASNREWTQKLLTVKLDIMSSQEFSELLMDLMHPEESFFLEADYNDISKWQVLTNRDDKTPYPINLIDRDSFEKLSTYTSSLQTNFILLRDFIKSSGLEGALEVYKQLEKKEF